MSDESELRALLTLSLTPGVGPRIHADLLAAFGSARSVLDQSDSALRQVSGVGNQLAQQIRQAGNNPRVDDTLRECARLNVQLLARNAADYPRPLQHVDDSPGIVYCRGRLLPQDELAVAIVGSRRCTRYGKQQAERLATSLARAGFTIISGLARGIDGAAHRGAIAAGGRTIAVMATGVRQIYPPEHADLALDVIKHGAVLSEFPLDQKPRPGLFPQRNRIISGLSLGVIVVEATRNSGALYTARHAFEQGREVFAVPGPVDSVASEGCHDLIRDGATLVRNTDDVLKELGPLPQPTQTADAETIHNPRELTLNAQEKEVLSLIGSSPIHVDEILRTTQLDMSRVLSTLTVLEMKRFIRRHPGNMITRS